MNSNNQALIFTFWIKEQILAFSSEGHIKWFRLYAVYVFLGILGIHNWLQKKYWMGILYLGLWLIILLNEPISSQMVDPRAGSNLVIFCGIILIPIWLIDSFQLVFKLPDRMNAFIPRWLRWGFLALCLIFIEGIYEWFSEIGIIEPFLKDFF